MKILPDLPKFPTKENKGKGLPKFPSFSSKEKPVIIEDEPLQLDLGLKQSPLNKLFEVRQKLDKMEDRIRLSHYWKNPLIWITLLFPLIMAAIFFKYYIAVYSNVPDLVPLVWVNNDFTNLFLPKIWLIIIPLITVVTSLVTTLLFRLAYRKLEKFVVVNMMFFIILTVIGYSVVWNVTRLFV